MLTTVSDLVQQFYAYIMLQKLVM